jgi:hypothetical protein
VAQQQPPAKEPAVVASKATPPADSITTAAAQPKEEDSKGATPEIDSHGTQLPPVAMTGPPDSPVAAPPEEEETAEGEPFDPSKQVELMSHLQDTLPAHEFTRVPLGQYVAFLSKFSTVPMTIDSQSLATVGKSAKTQISVKLDDATVERALKTALQKPGLTFHVKAGGLVITAKRAKAK